MNSHEQALVRLTIFVDGEESRVLRIEVDLATNNDRPGLVNATHAMHLGVTKPGLLKVRLYFQKNAKAVLFQRMLGKGTAVRGQHRRAR